VHERLRGLLALVLRLRFKVNSGVARSSAGWRPVRCSALAEGGSEMTLAHGSDGG
jgi:hypothetical protein